MVLQKKFIFRFAFGALVLIAIFHVASIDFKYLNHIPDSGRDMIDKDVLLFLDRIESSLSNGVHLTNNHGISKDDVIRLQKIKHFLTQRKSAVIGPHSKCSEQEKQAQSISLQNKSRLPRICIETEYYKVAQIAIPEAITFVDAGANRGYIGAEIIGLWGGRSWAVTPYVLQDHIIKKIGRENACGFCDTVLSQ